MKIYIAGRIAGDPLYKVKFAAYANLLTECGDVVLNPATITKGLPVADCMKICFAMIDVADAVVFLPDWEQSGGARLEKAYCDYTGKQYTIPKENASTDKKDVERCPFCGAVLDYREKTQSGKEFVRWEHRKTGCILDGIEVYPDTTEQWNRRFMPDKEETEK